MRVSPLFFSGKKGGNLKNFKSLCFIPAILTSSYFLAIMSSEKGVNRLLVTKGSGANLSLTKKDSDPNIRAAVLNTISFIQKVKAITPLKAEGKGINPN
jgi:hypothetical protein